MIPFSPPRIDQKTIDEVTDTLKSGWITTGPKTKKLEQEFNAFCATKKTLCVNSATAGMELILRWFGVGPGDEVLVPAYTYCATANIVIHCGAKPVMVDVLDDFTIDPNEIKKHLTSKTKVIIPVDIGGLPCRYDQIMEIAQGHTSFTPSHYNQEKLGRILVMSDAAHSAGAQYLNQMASLAADVSVYSFHAVKNLTTAEGGAITMNLPEPFDHDQIYNYLNTISLHGQNKDAFAKINGASWKYDVIEAGYKCNMPDLAASIGLVELKRYQETLDRRKEITALYQKGFEEKSWAQLPVIQDQKRTSSYHLFMLRIKGIDEPTRDQIIERITEKGVSVNVHFQPLPLLSVYKNMGYKMADFPVAYDNYAREISLPIYYNLTNNEVQQVIDAVISSVEEMI